MTVQVRVEEGPRGLEVVKAGAPGSGELRVEAAWLAAAAHPAVAELIELSADGAQLRVRHVGLPLGRAGVLRLEEAGGFVAALSTVVADLHEAGVAHGRLDPEHVLVDGEGRPRLCGFRCAAAADDAATAADVAAIGVLLTGLLERAVALGGRRAARALLRVASAATDPVPTRRPTARQLARLLAEAVPAAVLPARGATSFAASPTPPDGPGRVVTIELPEGVDLADDVDDAWARFVDEPAEPEPAPARVAPARGERAARRRPPPPPTRLTGDRVAVVAAVAAVGLVLGLLGARALRPPERPDVVPVAASPGEAAAEAPTTSAPATTAPPTAPEPTCLPPELSGPDLDGDECPDAVLVDGRTASVGGQRVELGEAGDLVAVGDWDCDGVVTPALLRPSTGSVFVFPSWRFDTEITVRAAATVTGAVAFAPPDGAACPQLAVVDAGGAVHPVTEEPA